MIQELVNNSYEKCFQWEMETLFGDFEFDAIAVQRSLLDVVS